jgi:Asp-tRNA(Asn)/Glu-tRNA(Gln) amidotransferase A subunit family amidase
MWRQATETRSAAARRRSTAGAAPAPPPFRIEEATIIRSRQHHPSIEARLRSAQDGQENAPDTPACKAEAAYRDACRAAVEKTMDEAKLDAFVYPTWSNPPRLIGDLNTPHGDNSQVFSPTTRWPAIQLPMGYTRGTLPAGITIFGRAWSEPTLITFAYADEQATHHRHPPAAAPPLR